MSTTLDINDRKILFELEQNSRQSLSQLGRKVRLKKETVFHRMKNLEQRGIIKNYLTEINVYKLGYQFYPLLLRFQNTTPEIEREIFSALKLSKFIAWLTKCEGAWDINATLIAKSSFELQTFLSEFLRGYSSFIAEKQIFITTEIHYFKRGFWLNKRTGETVTTGGGQVISMDNTDVTLLKLLGANARKPLVEIGKELGIHPKMVAYRIKKLEKQNMIQGSRILVDFAKIGYKFYKVWFSLKNMTQTNYTKLFTYFQLNPNIIWATRFIGYYDLSIEMEVKDVEEFRQILDDIKAKFSDLITRHESLLIFEENVMNYLP